MRIAYLDEHLLSLNGLKDAFQTIYPQARIESISIDDVTQDNLSKFQIVALPGCNGESSPYPHLLTTEKIDALKNAMHNNGMVMVTFCAASYFMADRIIYETRNGEIKERDGLGLIKGTASHAFRHITRQYKTPNDLRGDYIEANLISPLHSSPIKILNVNGPAFHLSPNEECKIFLEYTETNGAAGIIKQIGKGKLIALGVHPELSSRNSDRNFSGLFDSHEKDRFTVLDIMRDIINRHRFGLFAKGMSHHRHHQSFNHA